MATATKLFVTAAFIRAGHAQACSTWQEKLETKFPGVFRKQSTTSKVQIGDRIKSDRVDGGTEYMMAAVTHNTCALISLKNGNRFTDPVSVTSNYDIKLAEFKRMLGSQERHIDTVAVNGKPLVFGGDKYTMHDSEQINVNVTFVKEAYEAANSEWKEKIKAQFPQVFAPVNVYAQLVNDSRGGVLLSTSSLGVDGVTMIVGDGLAPRGLEKKCIMVPKSEANIEVTEHNGYWVIAFKKSK